MITKKNNRIEIDTKQWIQLSSSLDADCRGWFINLSIHFFEKNELPEDKEKLALLASVKFSEYNRFIEVIDSVIIPLINEKVNQSNKNKLPKLFEEKFDFKEILLVNGADIKLVEDWLKVRKDKKASNTETAFKTFIEQVKQSNLNINQVLTICCDKSWKGFKASWLENIEYKNTLPNHNVETVGRTPIDVAFKNANNFSNVQIPD